MKTALVTGDAGFIGRHIRTRLEHDGWDVTICDAVRGDDCRRLFSTARSFNLVVHCAAVIGGRSAIDNEPLKVATNFALDSDFFRYVALTRPDRAVYFSSSAAYPIMLQTDTWVRRAQQDYRLREDWLNVSDDRQMLEQPDAIYGWIKLTGERLARIANADGAKIHVFRPFSGYGTDQDLDYPFPALLKRAQERDDPFVIWGTGDQTRDWIHVDDIVGAVMSIIDEDPADVGPVNLCTGRATSFIQLARMMIGATGSGGYAPEIKTLPDAPTGVMHRVGNPIKLQRLYMPKITIEEGVLRCTRP